MTAKSSETSKIPSSHASTSHQMTTDQQGAGRSDLPEQDNSMEYDMLNANLHPQTLSRETAHITDSNSIPSVKEKLTITGYSVS